MKWYAFIPFIGYFLWYRNAESEEQLWIVFLYQILCNVTCVTILKYL